MAVPSVKPVDPPPPEAMWGTSNNTGLAVFQTANSMKQIPSQLNFRLITIPQSDIFITNYNLHLYM